MTQSPTELKITVPGFGEGATATQMMCYHWQAVSPADRPPVLCVHGLTRNGRDFDFLAQALAGERTLYAPDMPGRGKSEYLSFTEGYSYPAYVGNIGALLQSQGIAQVDWVGTSMGGIIGMMVAATFPGLIRRLVLNDIGCLIPAAGLERIMAYAGINTIYATKQEAEQVVRERCAPYGIRDEAHWQHLFTHGIVQVEPGWRLAYDPAIMPAMPARAPIEDVNLWALWPALANVPLMIIRGADSDILTHETASQMASQHPNAVLHELAGIGHAPALMADDQIALVKSWLDAA